MRTQNSSFHLLLVATAALFPVQQATTSYTPGAEVMGVHQVLVSAVLDDDANLAATQVQFPLPVHCGKKFVEYSRSKFIENYHEVFNPYLKSVLLNQSFSSYELNGKIALFKGEIFISGICHDKSCENRSAKVTFIDNCPLPQT